MKIKNNEWSLFKKLLYGAITSVLVAAVVGTCALWLNYYSMSYPELSQAAAMRYVEELPLEGILLWDERVVVSPREGVVTYPSFVPRRVAKGEVIAAVDGAVVRADAPGYFLPALDGQEGEWIYSKLWPGVADFPVLKAPEGMRDGTYLLEGDSLGKLAPMPQELRCIAYLDRTPLLERNINSGFVNVKVGSQGRGRRAEVRAASEMGQKIKLYITLPFFPPSALLGRTFSCGVQTGDLWGVTVPDTAVILREGKQGVFGVRGNTTEFQEVEGFPVDKYNFFVTDGLQPNDMVLTSAQKAKEGVVIQP